MIVETGGVEVDVVVNTVITPLASVEVCSVVTGKGMGVVVIVIVVTVGDGCADGDWVVVVIGADELEQLANSVEVGLTKVMRLVMIRGSVTLEILPIDVSIPLVFGKATLERSGKEWEKKSSR